MTKSSVSGVASQVARINKGTEAADEEAVVAKADSMAEKAEVDSVAEKAAADTKAAEEAKAAADTNEGCC
jgi:hypothetical protein